MTLSSALFETTLKSLPFLHRGKVRDIYAVDADKLLIVQTDRLSAFDVILPTAVPEKGKILTALSQFWFDRLAHIMPNHLTGIAPASVVAADEREQVLDRAFVIRRLTPLPIEVIVRGYVIGSGWKDYQRTGAICGIPLPPGLKLAEQLPGGAIFTPSTKAPAGAHDENISLDEVEKQLGKELTDKISHKAIQLYTEAADYALSRGIIIADTKFEFGLDEAGELYLIDEVLTPDSSRFWPVDGYQPGVNSPSFDKQFVRDYLETLDWNKQSPGPELRPAIVARTVAKYREALERLTGAA